MHFNHCSWQFWANNFHFSDFYHQDQGKLAQTPIPDEFLEIGMTCAALYNHEWHRGKIVDIFDETLKVTASVLTVTEVCIASECWSLALFCRCFMSTMEPSVKFTNRTHASWTNNLPHSRCLLFADVWIVFGQVPAFGNMKRWRTFRSGWRSSCRCQFWARQHCWIYPSVSSTLCISNSSIVHFTEFSWFFVDLLILCRNVPFI